MPTFAPDIATLEATAGRLPEWFTEDQAGNLNPDTFTAWTQARDAHARIQLAGAALAPLYHAATEQAHGGQPHHRSRLPAVRRAAQVRHAP